MKSDQSALNADVVWDDASDEQYMLYGQMAEEIRQLLAAGQEVDEAALVQKYPKQAAMVRQLLPSIVALYELGYEANTSGHDPRVGTIGDFRIVREIGRGGMGVVYEAEQLSLNRQVALKILPFAAVLDQRQLRRFKNESLAAANLDHPNIVDVYGVGCERGVHYYAMRLIEGRTLADVIQEMQQRGDTDLKEPKCREAMSDLLPLTTSMPLGDQSVPGEPPLAAPRAATQASTLHNALATDSTKRSRQPGELFRAIAQLGAQVADALDYAHQQGVVHRDIKPSNLILDARGTVWVTDFGLARIESDHSMTMTGEVLGTLRYMSPEQVLAKRVIIDHRTDIYSLGVSLYELLTLRAPFDGSDRQEILRKISFEEPIRPRRLNPAVPADLETIVLKSIEKNPDDRYATAAELAADLRRCLNDETIKARPAGVVERVVKWSRRHTVSVRVATGLLLVVAILTSAASVWLTVAVQNLKQQTIQAEAAQLQAEQRRDRARRDFRLARDAVEMYLSRVADDPRLKQHGFQSLRRGLLESAQEYYEQFIREAGDDPMLQADLARALQRLAKIHAELGQTDKAVEQYHAAIAVFEDLTGEPDVNASRHIAESRASLALTLYGLGRLQDSEHEFKAAILAWRKLSASAMNGKDYEFRLAKTEKNLGILYDLRLERRDEAERLYRDAYDTFCKLAEPDPTIDQLHEMAATQANLGNLYANTGRPDQAEEAFKTALELCEQLTQESAHPKYADFRFAQAATYNNFGSLHSGRKRWDDAIDAYNQAAEIWRALSVSHPEVPLYESELAKVLSNTAGVHAGAERPHEASQAYRDAIDVREDLVTRFPSGANYHNDASHTYGQLAEFSKSHPRGQDAIEAYEKAVEFGLQAVELSADSEEFAYNLATKHNNLFELYANTGRTDEAREQLLAAIAIREQLVETNAGVLPYACGLAENYVNLGMFERDQKRLQESTGSLNKAIHILEEILKKSPHDKCAGLVIDVARKTLDEVSKASR